MKDITKLILMQTLSDRMHNNQCSKIQSETDFAFLKLKISEIKHEVFSVLFLDTSHGVIQYQEMFRGTVDGASVHPREVVKEALACNASAVIFCHNHPSGVAEPSKADESITKRLKDSLALIDVRALDHLIIGSDIVSFAERGLI